MKQYSFVKAWDIIYPVGIYYVVTTIVLLVLDVIMPLSRDSQLFRQMIAGICSVPVLFSYYKGDQQKRGCYFKGRIITFDKGKCLDAFCMLLFGACFSVALNNLIGYTNLGVQSKSYQQVTETFYTGRLVLEIAALCILIPFVEELLYRGIVYGRLKDWMGVTKGIMISSLIFGIIHVNIVQFVYATIFGIFLAFFVEYTGFVYGAALAHMAANLMSVLRAETNLFHILEKDMVLNVFATVGLLLLSALLLLHLWKKKKMNENP